MAINATTRAQRTVSFAINAPRIEEEVTCVSPPTRHGASRLSQPRLPEAGGPWTRVLSRREKHEQKGYGRRDGHPAPRRGSSKLQRLRRCHRCLARDHLVAVCRDPVKCARCFRSGHRRRDCCRLLCFDSAPLLSPCLSPSDFRRSSRSVPPRERSPRRHEEGSARLQRRQASPPVVPRVRPASSPLQRATPVSTLRSFVDVLIARPEMEWDVCYTTSTWVVLANERCYTGSVAGALSEENERLALAVTGEVLDPLLSPGTDLTMVLIPPGDALCDGGFSSEDDEDEDEDEAEAVDGEMEQLLPCLAELPEGGEVPQFISSIAAPVNLLLTGHVPVLISPGDELCDGGFASDDDEDEVADGKMEQLLPGLTELDQVELLLDGEEGAHEDGLDDDGALARRELQLVTDVIDADAEAATIGNLFVADIDDASSSGIAIRCVVDLFSLPAVPLLPTPTLPMPHALAALPDPERRSSRLAAKPQLTAVGKAQRVLHKKMGLDFGDMPLVEATKEFTNTCKKAPFSDSAINGLRTLIRLNLPSMTAADEALIGLAGPRGSDFLPPTTLDVSA